MMPILWASNDYGDGNMKKTQSRVTLIDVAKRAGVSPATVSNCVNAARYVDAETKIRIDKAIAELGYVPNLGARRLRTGRANTVAVLSSMPFAVSAGPSRLGFMMEIAASAAIAALERQMSLVLVPPVAVDHPGFLNLEADGVLFIEPSSDDPHVTDLVRRGMPLVTIGRVGLHQETRIPHVALNATLITEQALAHLASTGARNMALFVGQTARASYRDAEIAYLDFATRTGMAPVIRRLSEIEGEAAGYRAACALLEQNPQIDAILVPIDTFATGVVQALRQKGRRIPQDVRVVTRYDGLRARESMPKLTAFNLFLDDIARLALTRLFQEIDGTDAPPEISAPAPTLIIRESSYSDG
jgi:DNA-binding LacI/PurR family transcriptional regulator